VTLLVGPRELQIDPETGTIFGKKGPIGYKARHGYIRVSVGTRRKGRTLFAHRVIWEAVHGPIPVGLEINHLNGNKGDNRIANLELTTRAGNMQHAFRTGLRSHAGERHPSHKLTAADVREIRRRYVPGDRINSGRALAREFGVSQGAVNMILTGRNWKVDP